jgi:hypothetical protein
VAEEHVEALRSARADMVEVRRRMAVQIRSPLVQPAEYAANFTAVQGAIEAIDRALNDEQGIMTPTRLKSIPAR